MLAACMDRTKEGVDCGILFIGFIQFVLGFLLAGYIWSIIWGVRIYQESQMKIRVVNSVS